MRSTKPDTYFKIICTSIDKDAKDGKFVEEKRTQMIENDSNPKFNKTVEFIVSKFLGCTIELEAYDDNGKKDPIVLGPEYLN